jgi:hypothetical protein
MGLCALVCAGPALAAEPTTVVATAATTTRTVVQHRAVFDFVAGRTDLGRVCEGRRPVAIEVKRTAADVAAAVFSGLWYTPVHLRVTCEASAPAS